MWATHVLFFCVSANVAYIMIIFPPKHNILPILDFCLHNVKGAKFIQLAIFWKFQHSNFTQFLGIFLTNFGTRKTFIIYFPLKI